MPFPWRLGRPQLIALAGLVILAVGASATVYYRTLATPVHPRLDISGSSRVRVLEPVTVRFDQPVDTSSVHVTVKPATSYQVITAPDRLVITPSLRWEPEQRYTVELRDIRNRQHTATVGDWKASFATQPKVGVAGFAAGGKPVSKQAVVPINGKVEVKFVSRMIPSTVTLAIDDKDLPGSALAWAELGDAVTVTPPSPVPYQPFVLSVKYGGRTMQGDFLTDTDSVSLTPYPVLPTNPSSGIGPDFKPILPIEVVLENTPAAQPQNGMQQADIAFEYVSEYQITRITTVYFNNLPPLIGPIRSCRMVNVYLTFAYSGPYLCSGASVGTLHYLFGDAQLPWVPGSINDVDRGDHFFRSGSRPAPHNVYTDAGRAASLRQLAMPPGKYFLESQPVDAEAGQPAADPSFPLHSGGYAYDAGSKEYLRFDRGAPMIDAGTGGQLRVKNVILVQVPFRDAGWIEDDNGGAHSIWYEMTGSGPAEIYSNGRLIRATWHMGSPGQTYNQNDQPMWFSDESGKYIRLNTGLTWIHIAGNGQ